MTRGQVCVLLHFPHCCNILLPRRVPVAGCCLFISSWQNYLSPPAVQHQEIVTIGHGITSLVCAFSIKSVEFRQTKQ